MNQKYTQADRSPLIDNDNNLYIPPYDTRLNKRLFEGELAGGTEACSWRRGMWHCSKI